MKLRVLYLSSWSIDQGGKIIVPFIHEQIEALSEEVEAVYVEPYFLNVFHWLIKYVAGSWITPIAIPLWDEELVRSWHVALPKLSTRISGRSVWQDFRWSARLVSNKLWKRIGQVDIIHAHVVMPVGGWALGLAEKDNIPLVIQEHSGPFSMHVDSAIKKEGTAEIVRATAKVLPVGESLAEEIKTAVHCDEDKIQIVSNWVRTDLFTPRTTRPGNNVIHIVNVTSTQKVKRPELVVETINELVKSGRQVLATIIGVGQDNHKLNSMIDDYGLREYVVLKDKISRERINSIYNNADIYLCTSEVETFGLAPAEAICTGIPVVSTPCGGPEEYIHEGNGIITKDAQPQTLSRAALELYENIDLFDAVQMWSDLDAKFGKAVYVNTVKTVYGEITN